MDLDPDLSIEASPYEPPDIPSIVENVQNMAKEIEGRQLDQEKIEELIT